MVDVASYNMMSSSMVGSTDTSSSSSSSSTTPTTYTSHSPFVETEYEYEYSYTDNVGNEPLNVVSNGKFVFVMTLIGVVPNEDEADGDEGTSTNLNPNTGIKMNTAQRRYFEDVTKGFLLRKLSSSDIFTATAIQSIRVRVIEEDDETSASTASTPEATATANPRRSKQQLLRGSRSQSRRLQDTDAETTASTTDVSSGRIEIVTEVAGEWSSSSSLQETRTLTLKEIGEHPKEYMNEFLNISTTQQQQQQQQQISFSRPVKRNNNKDCGRFFSGLTDVRVEQRPQTTQTRQHFQHQHSHSHPYLLANQYHRDRSTRITPDENINRSRSRIAQEVDNKTKEVEGSPLLIICILLIVFSLLFIMYRIYMDCFYAPEVETGRLDNRKKEEEKTGPIKSCLENLGIPIPWDSKKKAPVEDPQLVQGDNNDNKGSGDDDANTSTGETKSFFQDKLKLLDRSRSLDKGSTSKDDEASSLTVDGNTKHSNDSRAGNPRSQTPSNIYEDGDDNHSLDSSPSFHSSDSRSRLRVGEQNWKVSKRIRSKQQKRRQVDEDGKAKTQKKVDDPDLKSISSKSVPLEKRDELELGAKKKMPLSKSLHTPNSGGIVKKQKKKQNPDDQKEPARFRTGKRNETGRKKQKPLSKSSTYSTSNSQEIKKQGGPDLKSISTKSAPPLEKHEGLGTTKNKRPLSKSLHNKGPKLKTAASGSRMEQTGNIKRVVRAKNNKQAPIDKKESKTSPVCREKK